MKYNNPLLIGLALLVIGGITISAFLTLSNRGVLVKVEAPEGVELVNFTHSDIDGNIGVKPGESIRLQPREYRYVVTGDNLASTSQDITITPNTQDIIIDYAPYSSNYLRTLLEDEQQAIRNQVQSDFVAGTDYSLRSVTLYDRGQIAGVIITPRQFDSDNPINVYRAVYVRDNGSWRATSRPELLRTVHNTTDTIPVEVLKSINNSL